MRLVTPRPLCALLTIALSAGLARAQEVRVKPELVKSQLGLAGSNSAAWPGTWNWLTVVAINPLAEDGEAIVTFRTVAPQSAARFDLRKRFHLPGRTQRRVSFPVQTAALTTPPAKGAKVEVELAFKGEITSVRPESIGFLAEDAYVVGVLGDGLRTLAAVNRQAMHPAGGPEFLPSAVVRELPILDADVPDDPLGLDLLHALVVSRPSQRELRTLQWDALERWVQAGGNLIVSAADSDLHEVPALDAMLPVRVMGSREVTWLRSLATWTGQPLSLQKPLGVGEAVLRSGVVRLEESGLPLVVTRAHGLGTVTYLALEMQHSEWAGSAGFAKFWVRLLEGARRHQLLDAEQLAASSGTLMEHLAGRKVAGVWLPIAVCAGYLGLIGLLLRRARQTAEVHRLWAVVVLAALAFTGASYGAWSLASPEQGDGVYTSWLATGASPTFVMRFDAQAGVLLSRDGETTLSVSPGSIRTVPELGEGARSVQSEQEAGATALRFTAEKGRLRTLALSGVMELDGLSAKVSVGRRGWEMTVVNGGQWDLEASFLRLGRRIVPVGRVARGQRQVVRLEAGADLSAEDYEGGAVRDEAARLRRLLLGELFAEPAARSDQQPLGLTGDLALGTSSQFFWGGWIYDTPAVVALDSPGAVHRQSVGLLAVAPEWTVAESEFVVPAGAMAVDLLGRTAGAYYYGGTQLRGERPVSGDTLRAVYRLPEGCLPARIEQASLRVRFESEAYRLRVFCGSEEVALPAGAGTVALPQEALKAGDGRSVTLRLEVEPTKEYDVPVDPEAPDIKRFIGRRWTVHEMEVECVCRKEGA